MIQAWMQRFQMAAVQPDVIVRCLSWGKTWKTFENTQQYTEHISTYYTYLYIILCIHMLMKH